MVDGCKTMKRAVVVDLDGTLLRVNTFREYLLFAMKRLLCQMRLFETSRLIWAVTARKMRLMTHSEMKRRALSSSARYLDRRDVEALVDKLLMTINQDVARLVEQYRAEGCMLLLATAAPALYAGRIADLLDFDCCVATPDVISGKEWHENVGEAKLAAVEECLREKNVSLAVVITDHYDDFPLVNRNDGLNILVNPSSKTLALLEPASRGHLRVICQER